MRVNLNSPVVGLGTLCRIILPAAAGALLAAAAALMGGSGGHSPAAAQVPGFEPGLQNPGAPGAEQIAPGLGEGLGEGPGNPAAPATETISTLQPSPRLDVVPAITETETEDTLEETEPPDESGSDPAETAAESPVTSAAAASVGYINGLHYPEDRLIIVYKDSPLMVVDELSTATAETLLGQIEAQQIGIAISEDLAELDGGFDIFGAEVTGGVADSNAYFVKASGSFDPYEVSIALGELEEVDFAQPDYYLELTQGSGTTMRGDCFNNLDAVQPISGYEEVVDPCTGAGSLFRKRNPLTTLWEERNADWYINDINLDDALSFMRLHNPRSLHRQWEPEDDPLVAIIDDGFYHEHPDLTGRYRSGVVLGYRDPFSGFSETRTHGSLVASILAGEKDNGYGSYGVYQRGSINLLPLQVLIDSRGSFQTSSLMEAIKLAAGLRAEVINASFSLIPVTSNNANGCEARAVNSALFNEIQRFGGLYVTAAGNSICPVQPFAGLPSNVLFVAATESLPSGTRLWDDGRRGRYYDRNDVLLIETDVGSSYSDQHVQIAAPGSNVFVSKGNETLFKRQTNVLDGTSFAAPLVAGTAALMLQQAPNLTSEELIRIINATGRYEPNLRGKVVGSKTLDVAAAVECAYRLRPGSYFNFADDPGSGCNEAMAPTFGFSTARELFTERKGEKTIEVERTGGAPHLAPVTLNIVVKSNSTVALHGSHEEDLREDIQGTITFGVGETRKTFKVKIKNDNLYEDEEELILSLAVQSPQYARVDSDQSKYTLRIKDEFDDRPVFKFADSRCGSGFWSGWRSRTCYNRSQDEGGAQVTVEVELANNVKLRKDVTLSITQSGTAETSDVSGLPASVTFGSGLSSEDFTLTFPQDTDKDDEILTLTLSSQSGSKATVSSGEDVYTFIIKDNDAAHAGFSSTPGSSTPSSSGSEGSRVRVHVERTDSVNRHRPAQVSVQRLSDSTANDNDVTGLPNTVTIPANVDSAYFEFTAASDLDASEGNETLRLALFPRGTGSTRVNVDPAAQVYTYTIQDAAPPPPEFRLVAPSTTSTSEGASSSSRNVAVRVETTNGAAVARNTTLNLGWSGTARSGHDYTAGPSQVTVRSGRSSASVSFTVLNDAYHEPNDTVVLTLTAGSSGADISGGTYTHTITDNDAPSIGFASYSNNSGSEGTFTVWRTVELKNGEPQGARLRHDVTLNVGWSGTATSGTYNDYTKSSTNRVTLRSGSRSASVWFRVREDTQHEQHETIVATLSPRSGGASISGGTYTYTITDEDSPSIGFAPYSNNSGSEGNFTVNRTVELKNGNSLRHDVTLNVGWSGTASSSNDYSRPSGYGQLTLRRGARIGNVAFTVREDTQHEQHETVVISLSRRSGSASISGGTYTYTITDEDSPRIGFAYYSSYSNSRSEGSFTIYRTVELKNGNSLRHDVSLNVGWGGTATSGTYNDYTKSSTNRVTLSRGSSSASVWFRVREDTLHEQHETVVISLSRRSGDASISGGTYTYTITDEDSPRIGFAYYSSYSNSRSEGTFSVYRTVELKNGNSLRHDVSLNVGWGGTATSGTYNDYTKSSTNWLTLSRGSRSASVWFRVREDSQHEQDETVVISLSRRSGSAVISGGTYTYTILNDDTAPRPRVGFRTSYGSGTERDSGSYPVTVYVDLLNSSEITRNGSITLDIDDSGTARNHWWRRDVGDVPSSVTIPSYRNYGYFTFRVHGDTHEESSEYLRLTLSAGSSGATISGNRYTYWIYDND